MTPKRLSERDSRPKHGPRPGRTSLWALALGLLLGLVAFAPARWLAQSMPTHSRLALTETRGTVWDGSARAWLTGGPGSSDRQALPQRLHWRLALDHTGLALRLHADCCTPQPLRLSLSLREGLVLRIDDGRSTWPAQWLSGLGAPWNTLQLSGQLQLQTHGLELALGAAGARSTGQVQLQLQEMASALSTLQPLGSYRLSMHLGPSTALQLQTLNGDLRLSGNGQLVAGGLQFRGRAEAAEGREQALGHLLNLIGQRDGARSASLWVNL